MRSMTFRDLVILLRGQWSVFNPKQIVIKQYLKKIHFRLGASKESNDSQISVYRIVCV